MVHTHSAPVHATRLAALIPITQPGLLRDDWACIPIGMDTDAAQKRAEAVLQGGMRSS